MQFLSPGWLFALGTLALPVALHLWSRRGGTPVRVGSIRLLVGSPPAVRRAWRLQAPWLLLLRCAVLAALVLALAEPARRDAREPETWALVSGDLTTAADSALIDSLIRAGVSVRRLDPGNLWTALRDADREAAPGTRFVVFAPDRSRYFHGARPALRAPVEWHVRAAPSRPGAPARPAAGSGAPRRVAMYVDPDRRDDARYVTAAIRAAAGATGIPADVGDGNSTASADWIVWLSARPVPEEVLERVRAGATLLRDGGATSPTSLARGRGDHQDRIVFVHRQVEGLELHPPIASADSAAPLWTDGAGRPLLTVARPGGRAGRGLAYRFHGRFHPAWGDLVLSPEFPHAFAALWTTPPAPDDVRITVSQLLPAHASELPERPPESPRTWLTALWLLAVLLFAVERWLSR